MEQANETDRIAKLEAEVVRLRGQLAQQTPTAMPPNARPMESDSSEGRELEAPFGRVNRLRAALIAVLVLALGLGVFFGIYSTLSTGFNSLATKAAKTWSGHEDESPTPVQAPRSSPPSPAPSPPAGSPRVPGL